MEFQYKVHERIKDKKVQVIISYKDVTGKWKQSSKQGFLQSDMCNFKGTRKEKLRRQNWIDNEVNRLKELNNKGPIKSNFDKVTFKEVSDSFIEHKKIYNEHRTIINYKTAVNKFNSLDNLKMINISNFDIQNIIDDLTQEGLKRLSIKKYLTRIKLVFDYYKDIYKYSSYINPCTEKLTLPTKEDSKKKALTKNQIDRMLKEIKNNCDRDVYVTILIAATCGLRFGEILGLNWNDIKDGKLKVTKQFKKLKDGSYGYGSLKTSNSKRDVPIPKSTLKELMSLSNDNIRIVPRLSTGFNLTVNKYLKPYGVSIHELRHSYLTILVKSGLDFKTISTIAGHSVEELLKTYAHTTDEMLDIANDKIQSIF